MASTRPIAIIAGVGPGTGAALARKFSAAYPVTLLARTPESVSSLVHEINERGGRAIGVRADVSDKQSMQAAMEQVRREFGDEVAVAVSGCALVPCTVDAVARLCLTMANKEE
jgi:NAD(P)-dependent dehydrogenase (short-subunit alcohol dehydrogenase family)